MSLDTWLAEAYPITAAKAASRGELYAAMHSLQKWKCLKKEVLDRHDVVRVFARGLMNRKDFNVNETYVALRRKYQYVGIDGTSCALCHLYNTDVYAPGPDALPHECNMCPLCIANAGDPCDRPPPFESESLYSKALWKNELDEMITRLEQAVRFAEGTARRKYAVIATKGGNIEIQDADIELVNARPILVFDDAESADRFTVIYLDQPDGPSKMLFKFVGMSSEPYHPQGIGQHGVCSVNGNLGKLIKFKDLPPDCQKVVAHDCEWPE